MVGRRMPRFMPPLGLLRKLLPAAQFSKADLRAARDKIAARVATASNRFQAYLGPVLGLGGCRGSDPARLFSRAVIRVGREVKRDRVLTRDELAASLARHLRTRQHFPGAKLRPPGPLPGRYRPARRRGSNMRHGDLLGGIWKQSDNKASREHRLRLPQLALDQIGERRRAEGVGFSRRGRHQDRRRLEVQDDGSTISSGVSNWRLHDLRRTCATSCRNWASAATWCRAS